VAERSVILASSIDECSGRSLAHPLTDRRSSLVVASTL
jgi:hypothetical protein